MVKVELNEHGCLDDMPNFSQANRTFLTDKNWKKHKKAKFAVIGISDSNCEQCCQTEPLLGFIEQ